MKKPKLLAIDLGTYCDNAIMVHAMKRLPKRYDIVYLTDTENKFVRELQFHKVEHFKTPEFFIKDPKLKIADPHESIAWWALKSPRRAYVAYEWTVSMRSRIQSLLDTYKDIERIVVLYPALIVLWQIQNDVLRKIPTYMLYYAPGFVNSKVPWLFDSLLKNPNFVLYKNPAKQNVESGLKNLYRTTMSKTMIANEKSIHAKLKLVHHVVCWDDNITVSIKPYFRSCKTYYIGSIQSPSKDAKPLPVLPKAPAGKYIFMSFGSYHFVDDLKKRIAKIIPVLEKHCEQTMGAVFPVVCNYYY